MRIDRAERGQADALDLDQAAVRLLDEVVRALVPEPPSPEPSGSTPAGRPASERAAYYNVQAVLSARQRRVRRSTGSMTSLSIATITTSITKPHAIIPVKLPASYQ